MPFKTGKEKEECSSTININQTILTTYILATNSIDRCVPIAIPSKSTVLVQNTPTPKPRPSYGKKSMDRRLLSRRSQVQQNGLRQQLKRPNGAGVEWRPRRWNMASKRRVLAKTHQRSVFASKIWQKQDEKEKAWETTNRSSQTVPCRKCFSEDEESWKFTLTAKEKREKPWVRKDFSKKKKKTTKNSGKRSTTNKREVRQIEAHMGQKDEHLNTDRYRKFHFTSSENRVLQQQIREYRYALETSRKGVGAARLYKGVSAVHTGNPPKAVDLHGFKVLRKFRMWLQQKWKTRQTCWQACIRVQREHWRTTTLCTERVLISV